LNCSVFVPGSPQVKQRGAVPSPISGGIDQAREDLEGCGGAPPPLRPRPGTRNPPVNGRFWTKGLGRGAARLLHSTRGARRGPPLGPRKSTNSVRILWNDPNEPPGRPACCN
jgi:hypothetical protein